MPAAFRVESVCVIGQEGRLAMWEADGAVLSQVWRWELAALWRIAQWTLF
jgi:hypothetical protein